MEDIWNNGRKFVHKWCQGDNDLTEQWPEGGDINTAGHSNHMGTLQACVKPSSQYDAGPSVVLCRGQWICQQMWHVTVMSKIQHFDWPNAMQVTLEYNWSLFDCRMTLWRNTGSSIELWTRLYTENIDTSLVVLTFSQSSPMLCRTTRGLQLLWTYDSTYKYNHTFVTLKPKKTSTSSTLRPPRLHGSDAAACLCKHAHGLRVEQDDNPLLPNRKKEKSENIFYATVLAVQYTHTTHSYRTEVKTMALIFCWFQAHLSRAMMVTLTGVRCLEPIRFISSTKLDRVYKWVEVGLRGKGGEGNKFIGRGEGWVCGYTDQFSCLHISSSQPSMEECQDPKKSLL